MRKLDFSRLLDKIGKRDKNFIDEAMMSLAKIDQDSPAFQKLLRILYGFYARQIAVEGEIRMNNFEPFSDPNNTLELVESVRVILTAFSGNDEMFHITSIRKCKSGLTCATGVGFGERRFHYTLFDGKALKNVAMTDNKRELKRTVKLYVKQNPGARLIVITTGNDGFGRIMPLESVIQ